MWTPESSFRDAEPVVFWTSQRRPVPVRPPLDGNTTADLVIIGGGFTGLWSAIEAKTRDPARDVLLLEMEQVAFGASGRNGGFIDPSLTHGLENGLARYSREQVRRLELLGDRNFEEIARFISEREIACDFVRQGVVWGATEPYMLAYVDEAVERAREWGKESIALNADGVRALVNTPFYIGGVWAKGEGGLVDPAQLAWGLLEAALDLGVRVHEGTKVTGLVDAGARVAVRTVHGTVLAGRVVHATSAYPGVVRQVRRYVAPVYDYVLMSEPLTHAQRESIGWTERFGLSDGDNQFIYARMTEDHRILYGGWDAVYHRNGRVHPSLDVSDESHGFLARRFFSTFPHLEGLRFTHRWGGAIDTCSRFAVFFTTTHGGKVVAAAGYTGLGVGASRFGALTALDLVDGNATERTDLDLVRKKPVPFPPEPLRSAVIAVTRRAIAAADRNEGKRGPWLRTLDRLGLGFDS